jgi:toxin ParE1/3/4
MSARSVDVRLSRAALRDIDDLLLYMQRTWGTRRRVSYLAAFYRTLGRLFRYPAAGRPRDDLFLGCRDIHVEQHVIYYYQPDDATIVVRRILHQRQHAGVAVIDPRS